MQKLLGIKDEDIKGKPPPGIRGLASAKACVYLTNYKLLDIKSALRTQQEPLNTNFNVFQFNQPEVA